MAHREIERVEIDELEGRVTSALLTPYPPGIPLLIPGERFNRQIVKYLQFARDFNERFPGFDTDIHGLVEEEINGRRRYFVDCVAGAKVIAAVPPARAQRAEVLTRTRVEAGRPLRWVAIAAVASSDCGIVRFKAVAVFALTTTIELRRLLDRASWPVDAPLKIRST